MSRFSMSEDSVVSQIHEFQSGGRFGNIRLNSTNVDYLKNKMAHKFSDAVRLFSISITPQTIKGFIDDFLLYCETRIPEAIKGKKGSTSLPGLLPLYLVSRAIAPGMIIESGVFIGSSLHMFADTFSGLPIYAFDIDMTRLEIESQGIVLCEMDWNQFDHLPKHENTIVFFDDHINCAKRILECQKKGIRWAIFDDSPSIGRLEQYRYPAIPSVPIILDEFMPHGSTFEWHHLDTNLKLKYTHDLSLCEKARKVIKNAMSLDLFSEITGASCGDKWLVEIEYL